MLEVKMTSCDMEKRYIGPGSGQRRKTRRALEAGRKELRAAGMFVLLHAEKSSLQRVKENQRHPRG